MKVFLIVILTCIFLESFSSHESKNSENDQERFLSIASSDEYENVIIESLANLTPKITLDEVYEGCGNSKYCLGSPNSCIQSRNCTDFGSVTVANGKYLFTLSSRPGVAYIAIGLSDDNRMGDDSVIECVNENGNVKVYTSFTRAEPSNYGARRSGIDQGIAQIVDSSINDGSIRCTVERRPVSLIDGINFDLTSKKYFLLLSSGSTRNLDVSIGFHDVIKMSTRYATDFKAGEGDIFYLSNAVGRTLTLVHGSFMIFSWIFFTALGIFSARFGKKIWGNRKLLGKALWFPIHQVCMSLTWILVITAIIIIWVDVGEWRTSTHSVLGIISAVLCFIQPITAFFRPEHNDEARPIFNFMHGSVGKLAHLFAVITIFVATTLPRAEFPGWTKYILISYVVIYLIVFAALNNLGVVSDIQASRLKRLGENKARAPLLVARNVIFGVFVAVIFGITITLIVALVQ